MTEKTIIDICENTECFKTPNLNHQLLLHRRGFRKIENLEAFTNVKTLFLEGNSILKIENLHPLVHLRALYLQENCIGRELGLENLVAVPLLMVLNLRSNGIKTLEGFPRMASLQTLILRNNEIECITPVLQSRRLTTVDLSHNRISDPAVLDHLGQLEDLKVLFMKSNPLIETMSFYRKRALVKIPNLTFLDDRPIFPNEKRLSEAWVRGGRRDEDREREVIKSEQESGGHSRHYTMDDEEQFSEEDPADIIGFGVEQYTIASTHQEDKDNSDESDGSVPSIEIKTHSSGKGEKLETTQTEENEDSLAPKQSGISGLEVKEGLWNETLDQLLTMNASAYQYNFEQVSDHMKIIAVSESVDPEFYTQEECENRWKILDSNMKNETWLIPEAAEACVQEIQTAMNSDKIDNNN